MVKSYKDFSCTFEIDHEEKKIIDLRKKVNELYFTYGHRFSRYYLTV